MRIADTARARALATVTIGRRTVIGGGAALLAARTLAATPPSAPGDGAAIAALDAAARCRDPQEALALLAPIGPVGLSRGTALDIGAARAWFALDLALTRTTDPAARFALLLRRAAGSGVDFDRARARIDSARAALELRAAQLFARIGDRSGPIADRFVRLYRDGRFRFPDDDARSRVRAAADCQTALAGMQRRLPLAFADVPAPCLRATIGMDDRSDTAAHPDGLGVPPPGDPAPRHVSAGDPADLARLPRWSLPALVAQRLLPGRMLQETLEGLARPHPLRLRAAPAFPEGWAIRALHLAAQEGAFAGDPRAELGHLHALLARIARASADIGINRAGWAVATARARLGDWLGVAAPLTRFDADLARIADEPGRFAAEAIVWLAIADRSRRLRGAALARFHTGLLAEGRLRIEQFPCR